MKVSILAAIAAMVLLFANNAHSQTWKTTGNNGTDGTNFLGTTDHAALQFKTNDTLRMKIGANGGIKMKGLLTADSSFFNGPATFAGGVTIYTNGTDAFRYFGVTLPNNDIIGVTTQYCDITGVSTTAIPVQRPLKGLGINMVHPLFMLDIFCDPSVPTKQDINISSSTNAVGYRIGSQMFLWHAGDPSSIYAGVLAGGLTPGSTTHNSTFIGNNAGSGVGGIDNTFVGYEANMNGNITAACVSIGREAGFNNSGNAETFVGVGAGHENHGGDANVYVGYQSGYATTLGSSNSYFGFNSGFNNSTTPPVPLVTSSNNTFLGAFSGANISGLIVSDRSNDNTFVGANSGISTKIKSSGNVFLGSSTGGGHVQGSFNMALGYGANVVSHVSNPLHNANSIGAAAVAVASNTIILGGSSTTSAPPYSPFATWVGIGLSNDQPLWPLEINALDQSTGMPMPTGTSGLKFRQLNSSFVPTTATNKFLTVDANGDVVLENDINTFGSVCGSSTPTILAANSEVQFGGNNFYFTNTLGSSTQNSVDIGLPCGTTPVAKLGVYQNTTSRGTVGVAVADVDNSTSICTPTIGLASYVTSDLSIAGLFSAENDATAIFVPQSKGNVSIGYTKCLRQFGYPLDVNGIARITGGVIPSDSMLKKNIVPFNSGLQAIRGMHPVSYQYNGQGGFDTTGKYIGVVAQNLREIAPYALKSSQLLLDSTSTSPTTIYNVYTEGILYTAINGIKQLDSIVSHNLGVKDSSTAGYVVQKNASGYLGNSPIATLGGNVGIGITTPNATLQVNGPDGSAATKAFEISSATYGNLLSVNDIGDIATPCCGGYYYKLVQNVGESNEFSNPIVIGSNASGGAIGQDALSLTPVAGETEFSLYDQGSNLAMQLSTEFGGNIQSYFQMYNTSHQSVVRINSESQSSYINTGKYFGLGTTNPQNLFDVNIAGAADVAGAGIIGDRFSDGGGQLFGLTQDASHNGVFNLYNASGPAPFVQFSGAGSTNNWITGYMLLGDDIAGSSARNMLDMRLQPGDPYNNKGIDLLVNGGNYIFNLGADSSGEQTGLMQLYNNGAENIRITANGTSYFNGSIYTSGSYLPSDSTLKNNINAMTNCSSILCGLKPVTFNYNTGNNLNLPTGMHYGLIAQDVQNVLPNMVKIIEQPAVKDSTGNIVTPATSFKAVNYTEIVPILVKGYQEQQTKANAQQQTIDSLKNILASMQTCVNKLCADHGHHDVSVPDSTGNVQNITLSSATAAILYQNSPNPFSVGTKINYFLPEGTTGAAMLFFDMYGNKLKEVELNQTGTGTINIAPDNLKDGVYSYSLIINGQVIDTKKMILAK